MGDVVAQTRLELAQIQIEADQFAGDIETALGHHVMLAHVGCRRTAAGDPEQPYQADHPSLAVAVFQHQRGPGAALAQILRGDFAGGAVLLVGPGAAHIRHQVAIAASALGLARGGIEVDQIGRGQQSGHGIQQRGFARTGTADEQEALRGDRHVGQAVERAPVMDLQAAHAELLHARVGQIVGKQAGGRRFHCVSVERVARRERRCGVAMVAAAPMPGRDGHMKECCCARALLDGASARCVQARSASPTVPGCSRSWR